MPQTSLVAAYQLDGRGGGKQLDWEGVAAWRPEQGTLWVHLDRNAPDSRSWLEGQSGLDPLVVEIVAPRKEVAAEEIGESAAPERPRLAEPGRAALVRVVRQVGFVGQRQRLRRPVGRRPLGSGIAQGKPVRLDPEELGIGRNIAWRQ